MTTVSFDHGEEPSSWPIARHLARFYRKQGFDAKARRGVCTVVFQKPKRKQRKRKQ
jgi:ribulose bisphosphate carboxylase small subunit